MSRTGQLSRQQDHAARDVLTREWEATYSLDRHITPEVKARADAEWLAMDERGNLPEGWAAQSGSV